ncbi:MAG: hypothetical protein FWH55_11155, partial [Oscillospiraceae bacterium]|nr:hypothetical protein [Oscillospiraceae bacterium]
LNPTRRRLNAKCNPVTAQLQPQPGDDSTPNATRTSHYPNPAAAQPQPQSGDDRNATGHDKMK